MTDLYFADLSDPTLTTVGIDLNDLSPGGIATYGFILRDVDWGEIETEVTWQSDGEIAGAEQTRKHHPVVEAQLRLHADFSQAPGGYQDYLDAVRLLGQYLDSYGVLVWQPDGAAAPVYIDTYPGAIPALFHGQEKGGLHILEGLQDVDGYTFPVWRHPHPREASQVIVNAVSVDNSVGGNAITFTNPGTAESEGRLTIEVPGADDVVQVRVGLKSGEVTEYAGSFTNYTISGTTAVNDYWAMIDTQTLTPSDPEAMAGTYRVLATMTLADDVFYVQARWGQSSSGPQANSNDIVQLDADELTDFENVEVDLGLVTFDPDSPSLIIEIWARSEGDSDMGGWGTVSLLPADEQLMIYSTPGFRSGAFGLERWDGEELNTTGSVEFNDDGAAILDALNEAVEVKPIAGRSLDNGRHMVEFRGNVRNKDRTRVKLGELQVLQNGSIFDISVLRAKKGRVVTRYGEDDRRRVSFDVSSGTWRFKVVHTAATTIGRRIKVGRIRHWFIPVVESGRAMEVDTGDRIARVLDGSGNRIFSLHATGFPYIPPGEGCLVFTIGQLAPNGHDGVDYREPLPAIDSSTSVNVTLEVTPRHLHP